MDTKLLLFDLDGTLLRNDKSISERTLVTISRCRMKGLLIGVSTSRGERNAERFLMELNPDVIISSGGACVRLGDDIICCADFSEDETREFIALARDICGQNCEITVDTPNEHYWNYSVDPLKWDPSWGGSIYTDYADFDKRALKICVQIFDDGIAEQMRQACKQYDSVRFSESEWYKFTKKEATKEKSVLLLCNQMGISTDNIIAFGDDFADMDMLKLCGLGIAMGNAIPEVKKIADMVIETNEEDGIATFLEKTFLLEGGECFH